MRGRLKTASDAALLSPWEGDSPDQQGVEEGDGLCSEAQEEVEHH